MTSKLMNWLVLTSDVTPQLEDPRGLPSFPNNVDPQCIVQPLPDGVAQPNPYDYLTINGVRVD